MRMGIWPFRTKSIETVPDDDGAILSAFTGSTPGAFVTTTQAMQVPAVASAVRTISEAAASLDLNLVDRSEGSKKDGHAALDLLRGDVNEWTSGYEFIRDAVAEALMNDSGHLSWVNKVQEKPVEIVNYKRGTIAVQYEETREPLYRLTGRPVPAADIIHLRGPFEKCPITLAREAIGSAIVMEAHCGRLFKNGARPGGVIEVPKGIGEKALKNMKSGWRAAHEGADNAGKTALLFDGAVFKALTINSTDAQFLELRRFAIEEIARGFSMPVQMLGDLTKSSYANAEQKQKEFLFYCLEPWLKAAESAFNRALLSADERKTLTFRFDRDDLTRASLTERATAINSLIASETINPNEGREWLGLEPYAGGEKYGNRNINPQTAPAPQSQRRPFEVAA